jgi:DNA-binding NtrC family response regulator
MRRLQAYPWPGNIRQLKNVITNAVILSDGEEISDLEFGDGHAAVGDIPLVGDLRTTVNRYADDAETRIIRAALEKNGRNITKTALALGISRKTLYEKIRRHDL